jgi:YYY domain-containing protein
MIVSRMRRAASSSVTASGSHVALRVVVILILVLAALFRFYNLDWDDGNNVHPDERFVTMQATGIAWPDSIGQYFDSEASPLNPFNGPDGGYIYGTFPLFLQKAMATLVDRDSYDDFAEVGRFASGLFDLATVLLVFLIGRRLFGDKTGVLASLLLAMSVLPIQLAHFATSDSFMSALCLATFYFVLRANDRGRWWHYALAGVMFGLAVASKLSGAPAALFLLLPLTEQLRQFGWRRILRRPTGHQLAPWLGVALSLVAAAWSFRLAQPYSFLGPSPLSFRLDPRWLDLVRGQQGISSGEAGVPYTVQWADRTPVFFHLSNMITWGVGLPLGIAALLAIVLGGLRIATGRTWPESWRVALIAWPVFTIVYTGLGFMQYLRYSLPAVPFLALLAAALLIALWERGAGSVYAPIRIAAAAPAVLVTLLTLGYALAFLSVYQHPLTRLEASRWIYANIPPGETLTFNEWDDPIPYGIPGFNTGDYATLPMAPYSWDDEGKIDQYVAQLSQADYVIETSNRIYGSVTRIPERYPVMIRYYEMLFSGELGYELVAEFEQRPTLFGIELNDDNAEESFTVYDHPRVLIFRRTANFDAAYVQQQLFGALNSVPIVADVGPLHTGYNYLMFDEDGRAVQEAGGTWSQMFDRDSIMNAHPVITWYLALQMLALAAVPLCWRVFRTLGDRGYAVAKTLGLLGAGYIAWLLPSLHALSFGRLAVVVGFAAMVLISLLAIGFRPRPMLADLRGRWREIVTTEVVFLAAFLFFVFLRSMNPDLWHPARGGEKPMDFAYFNAVLRSTHFPPIDPWFAGGYINYYYFGYALLGAVTRITGIVPEVAFNLAVPTCFALLVVNSWSFVANLLRRLAPAMRISRGWRPLLAALVGPLLVALIGNLDLARRFGAGDYGWGNGRAADWSDPVGIGGDIVRGVWRAFTVRAPLPTDVFWAPSRVAEGVINEFPFWTFLFADFHPHLMALPFTSAALIVALGVIAAPRWRGQEAPAEEGRTGMFGGGEALVMAALRMPFRAALERVLLVVVAALATGALYPLNTWDFPTYTAIIAGAFLLLELLPMRDLAFTPIGGSDEDPGERADWRLDWTSLRRAAIWTGATVVLGRLLFLPYFANYDQPSSGFLRWEGTTTLPTQFIVIHGLLLVLVVSLLFVEIAALVPGRWHTHLRIPTSIRVQGARSDSDVSIGLRIGARARRIALPAVAAIAGTFLALVALTVRGETLPAMLAVLLALIAVVAWLRRDQPAHLLMLAMAAVATGLALFVEIWTLKGDVGRMNTVFKFYLQIWLLLGLVAAVALIVFVARFGRRLLFSWRLAWTATVGLLLVASAVFTVYATPYRLDDRYEVLPRTLDGTAYMPYGTFVDSPPGGASFEQDLGSDLEAIRWLQDNVEGSPVILEGRSELYRWTSRVSSYTGLPTVLGWDWHQRQQRWFYGQFIDERIREVTLMYAGETSFAEVQYLFDKHRVQYIYVGQLERGLYGKEGLKKFDDAVADGTLTIAFQSDTVTIYEYRDWTL